MAFFLMKEKKNVFRQVLPSSCTFQWVFLHQCDIIWSSLTLFWLAESVQWIFGISARDFITADYTIIMSRTLNVTGNHRKFARFVVLPVSEGGRQQRRRGGRWLKVSRLKNVYKNIAFNSLNPKCSRWGIQKLLAYEVEFLPSFPLFSFLTSFIRSFIQYVSKLSNISI